MRRLEIPSTIQQLVAFIRKTVSEAGFSRVVVNVSGGLDSATAAALAAAALGPENVHALLQPYRNWSDDSVQRAEALLKQLQIPSSNIREVDIAPMVEAYRRSLHLLFERTQTAQADQAKERIRLGNIMARTRMIVLYDHARELEALVLGTENKSEHYLGYYTRFGDEASDMEPLRSLYKTELYQVAKHLGIPEEILSAVPTAGLWPGQTDEGELGFPYEQADEILYGLHEAGSTAEELTAHGLDPAVVNAVKLWVKQVEYKHHLPILAPEPVVLRA